MADTGPEAFINKVDHLIREMGTRDWIEVYRRLHTDSDFAVVIGAFVTECGATNLLRGGSWGLQPTDLVPGCAQYFDGAIEYNAHGNREGHQPLVLERRFHGIKPAYEEISEEFRLLHNLSFDPKNNKYVKIKNDGSEQEVVRINEDGSIHVHAVEIKQFLAIKEMRLGLFFDIRRTYRDVPAPQASEAEGLEKAVDFVYLITRGSSLLGNGSFVRVCGQKLIKGFEKEDCGFWPYNERESGATTYATFIVGLDERGRERTLPCDPHGGNYLEPVFFRPDVLNRYYDNPSKYSVEDGYLRCGDLWGVQIDNDNPDHVSVFLGDIGRDIPESEHGYWRSFNIPRTSGISETAFRRSFLCEFADPTRTDLLFKHKLIALNGLWSERNGWPLFSPLSDEDQHCFTSLRIPASSEQTEFDTQLMYLAKVLVDSLNEAEITKHITVAPNQKGIDKLHEYLNSRRMPDADEQIQFLRDLQALRSSGAAHRKGASYKKVAKRLGLDIKDQRVVFDELLNRAVSFLRSVEDLLASEIGGRPPRSSTTSGLSAS
jgi:hypothetical protein